MNGIIKFSSPEKRKGDRGEVPSYFDNILEYVVKRIFGNGIRKQPSATRRWYQWK